MDRIRILFLAANPSDTAQLKTDEERRRIESEILKSPHRDRIQLVYEPAVQPGSLIEVLRRHRPQIVHFSGHGSEANEIILESDDGSSRLLGIDALEELFRLQGKGVRVVVLNACYSRAQAEALTRHVDFAIGMSEAIPDPMAIDFATAMYQGLAYGEAVRPAFDAALLQLRLAGLPRVSGPGRDLGGAAPAPVEAQGLIPEFLCRPTVDAATAVLIDDGVPAPPAPGPRLNPRLLVGPRALVVGAGLIGTLALVFVAGRLATSGGQGRGAATTTPSSPAPSPTEATAPPDVRPRAVPAATSPARFKIVDVFNTDWPGSGSATGPDGTEYNYAKIIDPQTGDPSFWKADACVFTFDCAKSELVPSVLIKGIRVIVQDYQPPPPYDREFFAAVERAHVYYCEIAPPKGERNSFPAVLLDKDGKPTQKEVVRLREEGEEAFKVRINTRTPGLYTIRCEMVVGYRDVLETVRLSEPKQYLFGNN